MALGSPHYLAASVPHVPLLPQYRPQLDVSLPLEDGLKILSENLTQFCLGELLHHPPEMNATTISSDHTSRSPVDLSQVSMEATQLSHLYLSPRNFPFKVPAGNEIEMCGNAIMNEVQFLKSDQRHVV
jgi:hypothetical protein